MSIKTKTFEECCDEVAKKRGYDSYRKENCFFHHKLAATLMDEFMQEAAELYNQETAAERDRLKEENEKFDKDNESLHKEVGDLITELEALSVATDSLDYLKKLNSELMEFFQRNEMLWANTQEKFESLISKANQQKEKP